MNSKHLFPMKLVALLNGIKIESDVGSLDGYPNDGLTRIALMTPEIKATFGNPHSRYRLAFPAYPSLTDANRVRFEIYSWGGELIAAVDAVDLKGEQAMAIQIELMYMYIKNLGGYINPL